MKKLMLDDLLTNILTFGPVGRAFCRAVGVKVLDDVADWDGLIDSLWRQTRDGGLASDDDHEPDSYHSYVLLIGRPSSWVVFLTADGTIRHFVTRAEAADYVSGYGYCPLAEA